ncbi:MAG: hypothetical protein KDA85_14010, partial [Planctomycetaceae bacterium]|nr:hypothetical protein [Planctomycetaceae bacterium]
RVQDETSATTSGKESLFQPTPDLTYSVERTDDGGMVHHEQRFDPDGRLIYDLSVPIDFAIGSGHTGRSYLLQRGDVMFASMLSWYTTSHRWDLSPGYTAESSPRFERLVPHNCVACHAGTVNPLPDNREGHTSGRNRFAATPVGESMISCERCHGPAADHVHHHEAGASGADPILQIAELSPSRQDALCHQCHLQGKRKINRYGCDDFSFQPGMNIGDIWVVFLKAPFAGGEVRIVSHAEQIQSSRCFSASDGALTCLTCHDAHSVPAESDKVSYYRDRCLTCHGTPDHRACSLTLDARTQSSPQDSCIQCHMPAFPSRHVPHTANTDHRIMRIPDDGSQPKAVNKTELLPDESVFREPGVLIPPHEVDRARGIYLAELAHSSGDSGIGRLAADFLNQSMSEIPDDLLTAEAGARAMVSMGQVRFALQAIDHALLKAPTDEVLLLVAASTCEDAEQWEAAVDYYRRLTRSDPGRSSYFAHLAVCHGKLGQWDDGIQSAEQAIQLDPSLTETWEWLSRAYRLTGRTADADGAEQMANRLQSVR